MISPFYTVTWKSGVPSFLTILLKWDNTAPIFSIWTSYAHPYLANSYTLVHNECRRFCSCLHNVHWLESFWINKCKYGRFLVFGNFINNQTWVILLFMISVAAVNIGMIVGIVIPLVIIIIVLAGLLLWRTGYLSSIRSVDNTHLPSGGQK